MTGVLVRVNCAVGGEKLNTGGRCGATVLLSAVFLSACVEGVSRLSFYFLFPSFPGSSPTSLALG
jgi:hypothetical protein